MDFNEEWHLYCPKCGRELVAWGATIPGYVYCFHCGWAGPPRKAKKTSPEVDLLVAIFGAERIAGSSNR